MNEEEVARKLQLENISLASINKRAIAAFIDELLISILFYFIISDKIVAFTSPQEVGAYVQSLMIYVLILKLLYQALFVALYGATLGKMAMKIRVIDQEYLSIPSVSASIIRSMMRIVSEMLFYFGFIVALFTPLRKTWHDKFAKTLVVDV